MKKWKTENPDAAKGYTTDAWWETEAFQKSVRERQRKDEAEVQSVKDARQQEIENIAMEWAKREYFRVSTSPEGTELSEEDFIKDVWDRALFEGDLKYRQMHGEANDPESEFANFQARQKKKQEVMLDRAKKELRETLDSDGLGGDVPGLDDEDDESKYDPDFDDKKMY